MNILHHFEINVATRGKHYMRVTLPQGLTQQVAVERCRHLQAALNSPSGSPFECTLSAHYEHSEMIDLNQGA